MFSVNEDTAIITIHPARYAGGISSYERERITELLRRDCEALKAVMMRQTGVYWAVLVEPYTGL